MPRSLEKKACYILTDHNSGVLRLEGGLGAIGDNAAVEAARAHVQRVGKVGTFYIVKVINILASTATVEVVPAQDED